MRILKFLGYWAVVLGCSGTFRAQTAPVFTTTPADMTPAVVFEYTYLDTVRATDADAGDTVAYSLIGSPPSSMALDGGSGVITWTPLPVDTGSHAIAIRAADPGGLADTLAFTVTAYPGRLVWFENFNDGTADGFTYTGGTWQVQGGTDPYLIQFDQSHYDSTYYARFGDSSWTDIELRARLYLAGNGRGGVGFGAVGSSGYDVVINTVGDSVACYGPGDSLLAGAVFDGNAYRWYDMRVIVFGTQLQVVVDDTVRLMALLPASLQGRGELFCGPDLRIACDDLAALQVTSLPQWPPLFRSTAASVPDTVIVGVNASFGLYAEDPDPGDVVTYAVRAPVPGGMTVNALSGLVAWLPQRADTGSVTLMFTASDPGGSYDSLVAEAVVVYVDPSQLNFPPVFVSTPAGMAAALDAGGRYEDTVAAVDPDSGDVVRYIPGSAVPDGFSVDSVSGALYWETDPGDIGMNAVTLFARDGAGLEDTLSYTVTVDSGSIIWYENFDDGLAQDFTYEGGDWHVLGSDDRYLMQLSTSHYREFAAGFGDAAWGNVDLRFRMLPGSEGYLGLAFGVTDTVTAAYRVVFDTETDSLSVLAPDGTSLGCAALVTGIGGWYAVRLVLVNNAFAVTVDGFVVLQGVLPAPVSGRAGIITGPDVRVALDDMAAYAVSSVPAWPPVFVTTSDAVPDTVVTSVWTTFTLEAYDPDTGDVVAYSQLAPSPAGMTVDPASGAVAWLPVRADTGDWTLRFRASDPGGGADTLAVPVTVKYLDSSQINYPPVFTVTSAALAGTLGVGDAYAETLAAADPDSGDVLRYLSDAAAPNGLGLDSVSGAVAWRPGVGEIGTHAVTAYVRDAGGLEDTLAWVVTVDSGTCLWFEYFDDGLAQEFTWEDGNWQVLGTGDKYLMQLDMTHGGDVAAGFGDTSWQNIELHVRFRLASTGSGGLVFGAADTVRRGYRVMLDNVTQRISCLAPDGSVLGAAAYPVAAGQWYMLRLSVYGSDMTLTLDGTVVLRAVLPVPVAGRCGVIAGPEMSVICDSMAVFGLSGVPQWPPRFITTPDSFPDTVFAGIPVVRTLEAVDPDDSGIPVFAVAGTPPGSLSVGPVTGTVQWLPQRADTGVSALLFTVTDTMGLADTLTVPVTVVYVDSAQLNYPPVFVTSADSVADTVTAGDTLSFVVRALDPNPGDTVRYAQHASVDGYLSTGPVDGAVVWIPSAADSGYSILVFTATDTGGLADTLRIPVYVFWQPDRPPVFITAAVDVDSTAAADSAYRDTVLAADPDPGDSVFYGLVDGPAGMTVGRTTGAVGWTPGPADMGSHAVAVRAYGSAGLADTLAFRVAVDSGRYLWYEDFDDDTAQGFSYDGGSWQVMGGGDVRYLVQLDMNHVDDYSALYGALLPAAVELRARLRTEAAGAVTLVMGAPAGSGAGYRFTVDTENASFSCTAPDGTPVATVPFAAAPYRWYALRITVDGGVMEAALNDTVRFARVLPVPADGRAGVVSGSNTRSEYDDLAALTPLPLPYRAPRFVTTADSVADTAYAGHPFTFTLSAVDSNAGDTLVFAAGVAGADGPSVDSLTGAGFWVADTADTGAAELTAVVVDPVGLADTLRIPVVVTVRVVPPGNYPPVFASDPDSMEAFTHVDSVYRDTVLAVDPDSGDLVRYTADSTVPGDFRVDSLTGAVTWRPGLLDTGFIPVTLYAYDDSGAVDTLSYVVFVLGRRPGWCRCSEQAPNLAWHRTYGGEGAGIAGAAAAGGYLLLQEYVNSAGRAILRSVGGGTGEELAASAALSGSSPVRVYGMTAAGDGTFIVTADTGTAPFSAGTVLGVDSTGTVLWRRYCGRDAYRSVVPSGNGFAAAGARTEGVFTDGVLAVLNADGDTAWTAAYGGAANDAFSAVAAADSGWLAAGYAHSFGAGDADLWLVRTDASGGVAWARTYGGPENDRATAVMAVPGNGWLVAGWSETGGDADAWLLRVSAAGDTLWTRRFGGAGADRITYGTAVGDDGYILAGYTRLHGSEDGWLLRVTRYGDTLWSCAAGGPAADAFAQALPTADGGFLVSGRTASFSGGAYAAPWALRLSAQPQQLFSTGVTLTLDSIAGAETVLADGVTLHYTVTDSLGRRFRIGDFRYSVGDSFSWNRAGFTDITDNGYRPPGGRSSVWESQATLPHAFASPLYVMFCVADSTGDSGWVPADSIPDARADMAMALVSGRMYLAGGLKDAGVYSDRLDAYDPYSDSWRRRSPLPIPLKLPAAAALDGRLYVLGGMNNDGASDRVFVYDPRTDRWSEAAPMPTARFGLKAVAVGSRLFAFGGFNAGNDYLDVMEAYDPTAGVWETCAPLPGARYNPAAVADGNRLYVFGGYNGLEGGLFPDVLAYDPFADAWDTAGTMRTPRHSAGAVMVNGTVVVAGGYDPQAGYFNTVESFDPATGRWRVLEPLPEPRMGPAVADLDGRLFVFGGMGSGTERLRSVVMKKVSTYSNYVMSGPLSLNNIHEPVVFVSTAADLADTILEDALFTATLEAATPVAGEQVRFATLPPTPAGLSVDSLTGVIRWVPLQADVGTHVAVYRAYDRRVSYADTLQQLVTVLNVNDAPVIDSIYVSADTLLEGASSQLAAYASDEDGDTLAMVWRTSPGGDTLALDGFYLYAPDRTAAGTHTFSVIVTDPAGAAAAGSVTVYVRDFALPDAFRLDGVVPHPLAGDGTLELYLAPDRQPTVENYDELANSVIRVSLTVRDLRGQTVRTLLDGDTHPGTYRLRFDGTGDDGRALPAGSYLLRLETERFKRTVKMVIVR